MRSQVLVNNCTNFSYSGRLRLVNWHTGLTFGYVRKGLNSAGRYGKTSAADDALLVSFSVPKDGNTFDITQVINHLAEL